MTRTYDPSLFAGTAAYYARYRIPYPDRLIRDIVEELRPDGSGRLLDLGCGTGALTLPLAPHFQEVVAVDPDPEMLAEAQRQGEAAGASNVRWLRMRAEEVSRELGSFRLVTCGTSFHWMDRDRVLQLTHDLLSGDGGIAIAGGVTPFYTVSGFWGGPEPWHEAITAVLKRWLGEERRAGSGAFAHPQERHERVLERSPFVRLRRREYHIRHAWDSDSIIGYLYSTSFAARRLFGERAPAFEAEVREALQEIDLECRFSEEIVFESLTACKG